MAQEDKIKWEKKYKETPSLLKDRQASKKLKQFLKDTKDKKALEIACGTGRNSIFIASLGYKVDALDISNTALEFLEKRNIQNIYTKQIDLENYIPPKDFYDLIVMTNYLDRDIIPHLINSLKKEGLIFIETYMDDPKNDKKPSKSQYLLKVGELKTFFDTSFEILDYEESFNEEYELYRMKRQSILVKKF